MKEIEKRYSSLLMDHLFGQGVAYFLFAGLFFRASTIARDSNSYEIGLPGVGSVSVDVFPETILVGLGVACLVLSFSLLVVSLHARLRNSYVVEQFVGWLSLVFAPVLLAGFAGGWLEGIIKYLDPESLIFGIFMWAGLFWYMILFSYFVYKAKSWAITPR